MSKLLTLSDEDYLLIEDALAANPRGRAFLRMRDKRSQSIAADEVNRMLRSLSSSLRRGPAPEPEGATHIRILRQELQEMSVYIQQTRNEIAALRPDDTGNNRIMAATGELDAIVTATERATSDILNSAERISELVKQIPRTDDLKLIRDELEAQVTEVLTACSFQDITGQRTTKVVNTLRYLEQRVNSMIEIWGVDTIAAVTNQQLGDTRPDAHLLNGPSLEAVSQDDVDALMEKLNAGVSLDDTPATPAPAAPAPLTAKPVAAPKPAVNGTASAAAINQTDIDALFD